MVPSGIVDLGAASLDSLNGVAGPVEACRDPNSEVSQGVDNGVGPLFFTPQSVLLGLGMCGAGFSFPATSRCVRFATVLTLKAPPN
jgi:hypothetical protein